MKKRHVLVYFDDGWRWHLVDDDGMPIDDLPVGPFATRTLALISALHELGGENE